MLRRPFLSQSLLCRFRFIPPVSRFSSTSTTVTRPKPRGSIRSTLFGFLFGSTFSGALTYFYLLEEYRTANELLSQDVDALRASILRIEQYVRSVEEKFAEAQKKGRIG